jgi:pyruvate/2-oxoacid:ferredoxin oxidoreductase alpha subunit
MKRAFIVVLAALALVNVSHGQTQQQWADAMAKLKPACDKVEAIVAEIRSNPDFKDAKTFCSFSIPMIGGKTTERHIQLTGEEIDELEYRRAKSHVAFHEENQVVKRIIAAHGVKIREYRDPCWSFVGIGESDHYITEEVIDPVWAAKHCNATKVQAH